MAIPRIFWIPTLALALASPAFAGTVCTDLVPPERYASMPTPDYDLRRVASLYALKRICGERVRLGCADSDNSIIYVLADAQDRPTYRCLIRHEEAHLHGWPADHPQW